MAERRKGGGGRRTGRESFTSQIVHGGVRDRQGVAKSARQRAKRGASECAAETQQLRRKVSAATWAAKVNVDQAKETLRETRRVGRARVAQKVADCRHERVVLRGEVDRAAEDVREARAQRVDAAETAPAARTPRRSGARASERRDEVVQNIPPELVPLYRKVGRGSAMAGVDDGRGGRMSDTERFLHYVHENPDEAVAARAAAAGSGRPGRAAVAQELDEKCGRARREVARAARAGSVDPRQVDWVNRFCGPRAATAGGRRAAAAQEVPF